MPNVSRLLGSAVQQHRRCSAVRAVKQFQLPKSAALVIQSDISARGTDMTLLLAAGDANLLHRLNPLLLERALPKNLYMAEWHDVYLFEVQQRQERGAARDAGRVATRYISLARSGAGPARRVCLRGM
jgi:hypothetical protein